MADFKGIYLIAFGSNGSEDIAQSAQMVDAALGAVLAAGAEIVELSNLYQTPAFPAGSGPDFVNAIGAFKWDAQPKDVIKFLHHIEADMGRERRERWAQRVIDLDMIVYGDQVLPDADTVMHWQDLTLQQQMAAAPDELILPHPRLQDRGFVLVPMVDVAPDWRHPILNQTAQEMLGKLASEETSAIRPIALDGLASLANWA